MILSKNQTQARSLPVEN